MTTKTACLFLAMAVAAIAPPSPAHTQAGFGGQAPPSPARTQPGLGGQAQAPSSAVPPSADEKRAIEKKLTELASRVEALAARKADPPPLFELRRGRAVALAKADPSLLADVDIYRKAAEYILRFPEEIATRAYTANTMSVLDTGLARARELEAGAPSWPKRKGHVVRAYVSRVDGSVQPYGLTIPESYDGTRPVRLDVWQHGTDRTLNEVAFIIQQERERPIPPEQDYIAKWLRGDVRVKDDRFVSPSDMAGYNLILFGDPGSNSVMARVIERLPIRWSKTEIAVGTRTFGAADHIPVLIYPNPLNPTRYVVINSGHTFGEADFRGTNAWLYPRLADYSVLTATGDVAVSGFFDEQWRIK